MRGRAPVAMNGAATSSAMSKPRCGEMPGSSASSRRSYSLCVHSGLSRRPAMRQETSVQVRCSSVREALKTFLASRQISMLPLAFGAPITWLQAARPCSRSTAKTASRWAAGTWITAPSSSENSARSVMSARAAGDLLRPVLGVAVVGRVRAVEREHVDVDRHPAVAGKGHLAHRRPQAAVGAVVVGQQHAAAFNCWMAAKKRLRSSASSTSGTLLPICCVTCARMLPPRRCLPRPRSMAISVVSAASPAAATGLSCGVSVPRTSVTGAKAETISDTGATTSLAAPASSHLVRIDSESLPTGMLMPSAGPQLHADRLDGVIQARVLAVLTVLTAGRHPVGRQLELRERGNRRRRDVGDGLADRHAARCRCVDDGQRRALAHRHGLAGVALVVERGDGHVGHRHLPRADHLVARVQPAHGTVADGDQERLAGDGRMAQHVARHGLQVQARHIDFRQHLRHAAHVAVHARRLAEQHVHRHVDREVLGGLGGGVAVDHLQLLFVRGEADHRERCALALAHGLEAREIAGAMASV